jgi:hypothetical protein
MKKAPDGRQIYIPRGRDLLEDRKLLIAAIAASDADLFVRGNQPVWVKPSGELVEVGRGALLEILEKYVAIKQLTSQGETPDDALWIVQYCSISLDEMTIQSLLREDDWTQLLPKMPSAPVNLSIQQQREVRERSKMGEPAERVAAAYGVDITTVKQLAR